MRLIMQLAYFLYSKEVPAVFLYGALVQFFIDFCVSVQMFVFYPNDEVRLFYRRAMQPNRWFRRSAE